MQKMNGFPVSDFMNDGETALINVDSPDGDFALTIDKDGSVCLEMFSPNSAVYHGKVV